MINNSIKKIFIILFFLVISTVYGFSKINTSIVFKINDQIITNIDLKNEKKFLLLLNPNLNNLTNNQIEDISEDSLKNRIIKEIELRKYFEIDKNDFGNTYINNFIKNSNFKNKENLIKKLNEFDLQYIYFKKNIIIDNLWREFIFNKFKSQVKIDTKKLKKQIQNQKSEIEELNLSEILFKNKKNVSIEELSKQIYEEIDKSGFEAAASIYSISDNKDFGGNIGWVKSNQISEDIYSIIKEHKNITPPIKTNNGYLIIKIKDRRKIKEKINFEIEFKKLINIETNKEMNKLGFIYFNKIKKRTFVSEK